MKKYFLFVVMLSVVGASILFSCTSERKPTSSFLKQGTWRGMLTINDSTGLIIPFNFDLSVKNDSTIIVIRNAEERIIVNEIFFLQGTDSVTGDSIIIKMPVFDSEFRCRILGDTLLVGKWTNYSRKDKNVIPFTAIYGLTTRFDCPEYKENFPFEGKWECTFGSGLGDSDSSKAIGLFKQSGHTATGTFLTETGDYRYLEGCVFGNYMILSAFDGSHAFVFHADILDDSTIFGQFYSGIHSQQPWVAKKNETFRLRNADSLTFLKPQFSKVDFVFPSIENKKVSLSDEKYKNKVVILQILGTWCPNCVDETMFLTDLDKKYRARGLEVIGLAFEKSGDFEKDKAKVMRLKNRYKADYEFLITGFHPKDADMALPMINHIMSFPTTLFIDKKGAVRKIHTGYSGPATGQEYDKFVNETTEFIELLLKEA